MDKDEDLRATAAYKMGYEEGYRAANAVYEQQLRTQMADFLARTNVAPRSVILGDES